MTSLFTTKKFYRWGKALHRCLHAHAQLPPWPQINISSNSAKTTFRFPDKLIAWSPKGTNSRENWLISGSSAPTGNWLARTRALRPMTSSTTNQIFSQPCQLTKNCGEKRRNKGCCGLIQALRNPAFSPLLEIGYQDMSVNTNLLSSVSSIRSNEVHRDSLKVGVAV